MMTELWTKAEQTAILRQLDEQRLPFSAYTLFPENGEATVLGSGAFASVFQAKKWKEFRNSHYAVKIIGFKGKHVDHREFLSNVRAQMDLCSQCSHILRIYDYVQLKIWLDDENRILRVEKDSSDPVPAGQSCLELQCIVMEKLTPVLSFSQSAKPVLQPEMLADYEETEIVRLGQHIADALHHIHSAKMLHRDVKLENIFYCPRTKSYKLGDFGISKRTKTGLAATMAFTKGYGAPEVVRALDEQYDCTADLYSFGMVLYLLLNELRFPDSEGYWANASRQYCPGYILPPPRHQPGGLVPIIQKMCRYDPDDRYASVAEVSDELKRLEYTPALRYRDEHRSTYLIFGSILMTLGFISLRVVYDCPAYPSQPWPFLLFLGLSAIWPLIRRRNPGATLLPVLVLGTGIWWIIVSGFSWWKILLVLILFCGFSSGWILSLAVLCIYWGSYLNHPQLVAAVCQNSWAALLLFSVGLILIYQNYILENMVRMNNHPIAGNLIWIVAFLFYLELLLLEPMKALMPDAVLFRAFGPALNLFMSRFQTQQVGFFGLLFCLVWLVREAILQSKKIKSQG